MLEPRSNMQQRTLKLPSRQSLVERWALRRLGDLAHEHRVVRAATQLFDLTQHVHGLAPYYRNLLVLGALTHDVGRAIDDDRHPQIGSRMILRDTWMPITPSQRRALAYMARYHRGAVPEPGDDAILHPDDNQMAIRVLLALLRAADALDSRQIAPPEVSLRRFGRRIAVTCRLRDNLRRARRVLGRPKKFRLLREELGLKVTLRIRRGRSEPAGLVSAA